MDKLKLILHITAHLILLVSTSTCMVLAKGFHFANAKLDSLLELNEAHTDGLIEE